MLACAADRNMLQIIPVPISSNSACCEREQHRTFDGKQVYQLPSLSALPTYDCWPSVFSGMFRGNSTRLRQQQV
jgi:hypothetical protein